MKKLYELVVIGLIVLIPIALTAQTRSQKKADRDTDAFRYKLEVMQTGTDGTYQLKVTTTSKKEKTAVDQAAKNAVHGVIFKGFAGLEKGSKSVQGQQPLATDPNLEDSKAEYFDEFFKDGGKFMKFVTGPGEVLETMKVGKEYEAAVMVSVFKTKLQQQLEADGIIKGLNSGSGSMPSVMVFPADNWMDEKGYFTTLDNQGTKKKVYDFKKALAENKDLSLVITTIGKLFSDKGFPLQDMSAKLKDMETQSALDNMDQSSDGGGIAESPRDMLLKTAKPDITLEVTWTVNKVGLKNSVTFILKGLDAGTSKQVAAATGTGSEMPTDVVAKLLNEAVLSHVDNFSSQLLKHFDDVQKNGREISLDVKVFDGSPKKLNDEIGDDGDELKDLIKKWMTKNTVNGKFNLVNASANFMKFDQVRIKLKDEDGGNYDADSFAKDLKKYIRKIADKIPCESEGRGLGKAQVTIGGKR